jgi:hypothetical protein
MGLITDEGRTAMAKAIKEQSMFLAVGRGDPEWGDGNPPAENGEATELLDEIGRKALHRSLYVAPDDNGDIEVATSVVENGEGGYDITVQRYSQSAEPTRYIYVEFRLYFTDAISTTIREFGLYVGSTLKETIPGGQTWFTADDFDDDGLLFEIEHRPPYIRIVNQRPSFAWVIVI